MDEVLNEMAIAVLEVLTRSREDGPRFIGGELRDAMLQAAGARGFVLAPIEATDEMVSEFYQNEWMEQKPRPREIWKDMISARPTRSATAPADGDNGDASNG